MLLAHIISSEAEEFTSDELKRLQESLRISSDDVILLIHSIKYIAKQSTKIILKPTTLFKNLREHLKLNEDKSEIFTKIWSEETNKDIGVFDEMLRLDDLAWEQNIKIADQISMEQEVQLGRLQLQLSDSFSKSKRLTIEFNQEELLQLYNTLEAIQIKLDNFNS